MKDISFFIYPADSAYRCACGKCGNLPSIARRSDGKWVVFCPGCDLGNGFTGMNPAWFAEDKRTALYIWGGRQLVHDLLHTYRNPVEVTDDYIEPVLG